MNEELKNIQDLLRAISDSSNKVFIVGHDKADLDSLASAIGLQTLCESLGKDAYIILEEPEETMEPIVKKLRDDNRIAHNIISMEGFELLFDQESTLIITDTNKKDKVAVREFLGDFKNIIVIDHHSTGETTISNASLFIPMLKDTAQNQVSQKVKVSSASEIVAQLLFYAKVDCDKDVYTYLYGGIYLDTNRFDKNVGEKTHEVTHILCTKGADAFAVKELFLADFDEDKRINNLVFNGTVFRTYNYDLFNNYTIGFTLNRKKPATFYRRETLAKAADRMMQYRIDAEFAMGHIDENTVAISARSRGRIDVGKIMEHIGGGGNAQNAAAQIQGVALTTLENLISAAVKEGIKIDGEIFPAANSSGVSAPTQYVKKTTLN